MTGAIIAINNPVIKRATSTSGSEKPFSLRIIANRISWLLIDKGDAPRQSINRDIDMALLGFQANLSTAGVAIRKKANIRQQPCRRACRLHSTREVDVGWYQQPASSCSRLQPMSRGIDRGRYHGASMTRRIPIIRKNSGNSIGESP